LISTANRTLQFGKLMLQKPAMLLMDDPTAHPSTESIELLNTALEEDPGRLLASHDREFASSLATRIIELTPRGLVNLHANYED